MPVRIAINAQIAPGVTGGTASFLMGLIYGLGQIQHPDEEYVLIGSADNEEWLRRYLGPNQRLVRLPSSPETSRSRRIPGVLRLSINRLYSHIWRNRVLPRFTSHWPDIPISRGFYESLHCDLIHFPYQRFTLCAMPSIYQPWDLLHRHYPRFFTARQIADRDTIFRGGCELATTVVVASRWVKQDIVEQYSITPRKIRVIPVAAPLHAVEGKSDPEHGRVKFNLPSHFMLYPAVTWPHKNHIRLLDAMALLRDRNGRPIHLVCTGAKDSAWPSIVRRVADLGLQGQVQFLGHVSAEDLRTIYQAADFVVFPSLFEGAGLPPLEAWAAGKALACADIPALSELVGDAARMFDPLSVESIAEALNEMTIDSGARQDFQERGRQRLRHFNWQHTARIYSALYRQMLHGALSEDDEALLQQTVE